MKKETAIGIASLLSDAQEWITRKEPAKAVDLINQAKAQIFSSVRPQDFGHLLFSPLDGDVHPWEWISALLADYKTLRETAAAAGITSDNDEFENLVIQDVQEFCEHAQAITAKTQQNLTAIIFSPYVSAGTDHWEMVNELRCAYTELREKAEAAGIVTDDPAAENEMLAHVGRFCEGSAALNSELLQFLYNQQSGTGAALDYPKE